MVISNPINATLGDLDTATCLIKNDDAGLAANASNEDDLQAGNNQIKLYPNPVKDILTIEGLNANTKTHISIVDVQGNTIIKTVSGNSSCTVKVKQLTPGTYYVKIETGIKTETIKFIKE